MRRLELFDILLLCIAVASHGSVGLHVGALHEASRLRRSILFVCLHCRLNSSAMVALLQLEQIDDDAKYARPGNEFVAFLKHVWRFVSHVVSSVHTCSKATSIRKSGNILGRDCPREVPLEQNQRISRTRVQTTVLTDLACCE